MASVRMESCSPVGAPAARRALSLVFFLGFSLALAGRSIEHFDLLPAGDPLFPLEVRFSQELRVQELLVRSRGETPLPRAARIFFPEKGKALLVAIDARGRAVLREAPPDWRIQVGFTPVAGENPPELSFSGVNPVDHALERLDQFFSRQGENEARMTPMPTFFRHPGLFSHSLPDPLVREKVQCEFMALIADEALSPERGLEFQNFFCPPPGALPLARQGWPLFESPALLTFLFREVFPQAARAEIPAMPRLLQDPEEVAGRLLLTADRPAATVLATTLLAFQDPNNFSILESTRLTAIALFALARTGFHKTPDFRTALKFLLGRQKSNGAWHGNPYKSDLENSIWPHFCLAEISRRTTY